MAWKGDTKNPVPNISQKSEILSEKKNIVNRSQQTRRDTDTQKDFTVTLLDIDTAIVKQLERFQLNVIDEGKRINVPVFYASPEKWKSIQRDGFMRDYNGKILLPSIVFNRTSSDKDPSLIMFNRYLKYSVIKLYSQKNRYTPFNVLLGQNVPVNEVYDVTVPDHMVFTYHFIIWTEYVQQMNSLVERLNFETDDYWGDTHGFRFRTSIESYSHTVELQVDQDRMVKTEFDLVVHGYLMPDTNYHLDDGAKSTTDKIFTAKKIIMGTEVVSTDFDLNSLDDNSEKWRSQKYPNLPYNQEIPEPPVTVNDFATTFTKIITIITTPAFSFHLPAPTNSSDVGQEGWVSYDSDYYYIYTEGSWKRVPISLFSATTSF